MTQDTPAAPLISIIVPTLNESGNIAKLHARVTEMFATSLSEYRWELVVTDNRSSDDTFAKISEIAESDPHVRAYRFSKNFGYQHSILAGYLLTEGDAVVQLDADMQDPPELVPELVRRWEQGAKVVYGVRRQRSGERRLLTFARRSFYRFVDWMSDESLPQDAGDFRLVDRTVVELLRHTHDANPYFRGTIASLGFDQVGFEYEREARTEGETKFRLRSLVRLAMDGILNHSTRPLQFASFTACAVVAISLIGIVGYLGARLLFGQQWPAGFISLALLQLFAIMLNAAFLGIIGSYLGRMYTQSRAGPHVVIEHSTLDSSALLFTSSQPVALHEIRRPSTTLTTPQEQPK